MSTFFSPNIPVGLKTRTTTSTAKVKASENTEYDVALIRFSHIPITNAPITAPGIEPIPPNTAATKALSPGREPETATIFG